MFLSFSRSCSRCMSDISLSRAMIWLRSLAFSASSSARRGITSPILLLSFLVSSLACRASMLSLLTPAWSSLSWDSILLSQSKRIWLSWLSYSFWSSLTALDISPFQMSLISVPLSLSIRACNSLISASATLSLKVRSSSTAWALISASIRFLVSSSRSALRRAMSSCSLLLVALSLLTSSSSPPILPLRVAISPSYSPIWSFKRSNLFLSSAHSLSLARRSLFSSSKASCSPTKVESNLAFSLDNSSITFLDSAISCS
mmetsp:Transcript_33181/g.53400  ORF Transcript_33181/g.53400 Transcript_33181/m.53400 type:complete len:259 (+) Transcript_33181:455-1231(+)